MKSSSCWNPVVQQCCQWLQSEANEPTSSSSRCLVNHDGWNWQNSSNHKQEPVEATIHTTSKNMICLGVVILSSELDFFLIIIFYDDQRLNWAGKHSKDRIADSRWSIQSYTDLLLDSSWYPAPNNPYSFCGFKASWLLTMLKLWSKFKGKTKCQAHHDLKSWCLYFATFHCSKEDYELFQRSTSTPSPLEPAFLPFPSWSPCISSDECYISG